MTKSCRTQWRTENKYDTSSVRTRHSKLRAVSNTKMCLQYCIENGESVTFQASENWESASEILYFTLLKKLNVSYACACGQRNGF